MKSRTIKVDYLARVEGEGALLVKMKGQQVTDVKLKVFEPPRFFEAFLRGRKYSEASDITARICGICPVAYQMSACHAMEDAFGVKINAPIRALRRVIYCGEWIESHALHVYLLHAPDFLGYEDAIRMAKDHPAEVQRGLRLKKAGNSIVSLLGGREIHPINVRVGGFYKVPSKAELSTLAEELKWAREAAIETLRWVATFPFPDFQRDYEFVALRHPDEYRAVVLRTGRNAIVAHRLDPDASGAYTRSWRTLVEPGSSILAEGITSGSFDTFGQLQNHLRIYVDVDSDAAATLAVGVVNAPMQNFTFRAHSEYFSDPISASRGVLLTRVAIADGRRIGSTVIDTHDLAELHGVRATPRGFVLVGRVLSEVRSDGSGWNAFTALVGHDGTPGPYSVVDVDRGDVLFDISALPSGRYLALGTTGYIQNPSGASISEAAQPLLVLLNTDGSLAQNLGYTGGARHNQLTTIAPLNGGWLLGGMINGPGTHSGDGDRALIVADGFLREVNSPAE